MEDERVVVIALDGSYHSNYAFDWYVENSKKDNDHVVIVTCFDKHLAAGVHGFGTEHDDASKISSRLQKELDSHKNQADEFREKLRNEGVKGEVIASGGKPGEVIVHVARDRGASMVICGSRGHGSLKRTIMGSISTYVVNHCHIPIVVVRPKGRRDSTYDRRDSTTGRRDSTFERRDSTTGRRESNTDRRDSNTDRRNSTTGRRDSTIEHFNKEKQENTYL